MTVWTLFLWKINMQLAEKWPEMVVKWAFVIVIRFDSDYMSTPVEIIYSVLFWIGRSNSLK